MYMESESSIFLQTYYTVLNDSLVELIFLQGIFSKRVMLEAPYEKIVCLIMVLPFVL